MNEDPQLAKLAQRVRALGFNYIAPLNPTIEEAENERSNLDEFLCEADGLEEASWEMAALGELSREPSAAELRVTLEKIFALILAGKWGRRGDQMKEVFHSTIPSLRP